MYGYTNTQLGRTAELPRSTILHDMLHHERYRSAYWKNRCLRAEAKGTNK